DHVRKKRGIPGLRRNAAPIRPSGSGFHQRCGCVRPQSCSSDSGFKIGNLRLCRRMPNNVSVHLQPAGALKVLTVAAQTTRTRCKPGQSFFVVDCETTQQYRKAGRESPEAELELRSAVQR